jgi:hypothetical protein
MSRSRLDHPFYTHFGYLTSAFANLEADLRVLIAGVAFGDNSVTAAIFLDPSHFSENIATLKKLGRDFHDHEDQFLEIAKDADSIRELRNLFIHGLWSPHTYGDPEGFAVVQTLRVKYEKTPTQRCWRSGVEQCFSKAAFDTLLQKIHATAAKIEALCETLEAEGDDMSFEHFHTTAKTSTREVIRIPDAQKDTGKEAQQEDRSVKP